MDAVAGSEWHEVAAETSFTEPLAMLRLEADAPVRPSSHRCLQGEERDEERHGSGQSQVPARRDREEHHQEDCERDNC